MYFFLSVPKATSEPGFNHCSLRLLQPFCTFFLPVCLHSRERRELMENQDSSEAERFKGTFYHIEMTSPLQNCMLDAWFLKHLCFSTQAPWAITFQGICSLWAGSTFFSDAGMCHFAADNFADLMWLAGWCASFGECNFPSGVFLTKLSTTKQSMQQDYLFSLYLLSVDVNIIITHLMT